MSTALLGQINRTGNYVGRCPAKGCKHTDFKAGTPGRMIAVATCPTHGPFNIGEVIGAYVDTVKCGARCTNAVGPSCDCSCGGANHGTGHAH